MTTGRAKIEKGRRPTDSIRRDVRRRRPFGTGRAGQDRFSFWRLRRPVCLFREATPRLVKPLSEREDAISRPPLPRPTDALLTPTGEGNNQIRAVCGQPTAFHVCLMEWCSFVTVPFQTTTNELRAACCLCCGCFDVLRSGSVERCARPRKKNSPKAAPTRKQNKKQRVHPFYLYRPRCKNAQFFPRALW